MQVVGKTTRGRNGYAEDGRVKKERLAHCNKSKKYVISVERDTPDKKNEGVNIEARLGTR